LFVQCNTQDEIDNYWYKLTEKGSESQCGWLKDKYGFSWQIVPTLLNEKVSTGEPLRVGQMMNALSKMKKLDITELEKAYNG